MPYSTEYQGELAIAARHLREAAKLTTQPTLKAFLESRAAAFLSNDYYDSDVKWMELDATIEPTIGPYEVYEDEWFNYKAAFEAFVTVKDQTESAKLQKFAGSLQEIENNLPIDPKYRNPQLGALAPIAVVNTVFSAGDANRGVQTAAFNLPNDERVIREKGSKRVMLKNNQEAKFSKVLVPISKIALAAADQGNVAFDAFFTHILMHELMHGLGPHDITVGGRATTVRQELKDTYSAIEEAKADVSGLFALQFLVDRGQLDKSFERTMYTTFLASAFRSMRFGINEAHGEGQAIQVNYLLDKGAFRVNADGTFAVDAAKIRAGGRRDLTREIMTLQAEGSYAKAKAMIDTLGVMRPEVEARARPAGRRPGRHRAAVHDSRAAACARLSNMRRLPLLFSCPHSRPAVRHRPQPPAAAPAAQAPAAQVSGNAVRLGTRAARGARQARTSHAARLPAASRAGDHGSVTRSSSCPKSLMARVGQVVEFRNSEDIVHNVIVVKQPTGRSIFDISGAPFETFEHKFAEAGVYAVSCDIHPGMRAALVVTTTPYATVSDADGRFRLPDVVPGSYNFVVSGEGRDSERSVEVAAPATEVNLSGS